MQSGNQNQYEVRDSGQSTLIYAPKLVTLQDLLNALDVESTSNGHNLPMLRTTAHHLSHYLGKPEDEIRIELLPYVRSGFVSDLRKRHYQPASVRSYANYVSIMEKKAMELGFTPEPTGLVAAWDEILRRMPTGRKCSGIASYAISLDKRPIDFSDDDLRGGTTLEAISKPGVMR